MSSTLKSLRALSDQTRLRLVALLEREDLPVNELQEATHANAGNEVAQTNWFPQSLFPWFPSVEVSLG